MRVLAAISMAALCACATDLEPNGALGAQSGAIIYGADDRKDVHEVDDPELRAIVQWSTVAMISQNRLFRPASGGVELVAPALKDTVIRLQDNGPSYLVCESEPFRDQQAVADCTGVLIDDDLVLTAAHCFRESESCDAFAYVFDFFEAEPGELERITASDVFGCRRIVARFLSSETSSLKVDYAIVQLDRVPSARRPVAVRKPMSEEPLAFAAPLSVDEPLVTIGYPSGLPAKIDMGARVVSARSATNDFFLLNSDTFKGSSGSGIYDANRELVGLLVRGGKDYMLSPSEEGCLVSKVVPESSDGGTTSGPGLKWEEATYVTQAIHGLCEQGYPSERLCGIAPACGDAFCTEGESVDSCPADCDAGDCGGSSCGKGRELPIVGEEVPLESDDAGLTTPDDGDGASGNVDGPRKPKKGPKCSLGGTSPGADRSALVLFVLASTALMQRRRVRR